MDTVLEVRHIDHAYGATRVLRDFSLTLHRGDIACLLGPSGCGKTTALRCIAGFESLRSGEIRVNGDPVSSGRGLRFPPRSAASAWCSRITRSSPTSTPPRTSAFGLRERVARGSGKRVAELLETVGLDQPGACIPTSFPAASNSASRLPARSRPSPTCCSWTSRSPIWTSTCSERISYEVRDILQAQNATAILVTHDQHEAFAIADEVGIMHGGEIQQWDAPYNLYHKPANRFVADFIGEGVFLRAACSTRGR